MRIVVCEDDLLILMNTAEMLRELGHEVEEAADGASAIAMLGAGPVDVLLTDVGLPDMTGTDLAARARALHRALPIIFASGLGAIDGFAGDARVVSLSKPYTLAGLEAALAAVTAGMAG